MRHQRVPLLVYGMETYLGREVARFGRSMGHQMIGVVDGSIPALDEPWMHGIQWLSDPDRLPEPWPEGPPAAIIYCDTALWNGRTQRFERTLFRRPQRLLETASEWSRSPRFVLRSTVDQPFLPSGFTTYLRRAEAAVSDSGLEYTIMRLPLLYGPDRPDSVAAMMLARTLSRAPLAILSSNAPATMRVETAALAALRAALEPDISGVLEPEAIARIGDVMIPQ